MMGRRFKEIAAIMMIGEGIVGAIRPRRYMRLWKFGPKKYRAFIDATVKRPNLVRAAAAAEAGLGVWLALRQITR
jgi:ribulose bisphosphate carboxylase small subunit